MARINVEDEFFEDAAEVAKRMGGDLDRAVGQALRLIRFAQQQAKKGKAVSREDFADRFAEELIPIFARVEGEFVVVRGAAAHFEWLSKKRDAGRSGGLARGGGKAQAAAEREKRKRVANEVNSAVARGLLARPDACASCASTDVKIEAHHEDYDLPFDIEWLCSKCHGERHTLSSNQKRAQAPRSKRRKAQPSYSSSFSNSSSDSSSLENAKPAVSPKVNDFVAAYCDRFKARWNEPAQIMGKDAGIAKRLAKDLSLERFEVLLDAYFSMPDSWLVKIKHPLATFETKLNEIVVFEGQGKFTTNREAKHADDMASTYQLLQKIDAGEI